MKIEKLIKEFPEGVFIWNREEKNRFWQFFCQNADLTMTGRQTLGDWNLEINFKWTNQNGNSIYRVCFYPIFSTPQWGRSGKDYSIDEMVSVTPDGVIEP